MRLLPLVITSVFVAATLAYHWVLPLYDKILFALETVAKP